MPIAHQATGIAEPAQTVDDLGETGAPLRSIAVVTTMSWQVVPRLVTWYTAPGNSIPSARTMKRDAEQESCITTRRDLFLLCFLAKGNKP